MRLGGEKKGRKGSAFCMCGTNRWVGEELLGYFVLIKMKAVSQKYRLGRIPDVKTRDGVNRPCANPGFHFTSYHVKNHPSILFFSFISDGTNSVFLFLPVVSLTSLYYVRHKKVMVCGEGKVNKRKHSVRTRPEFVCFFP